MSNIGRVYFGLFGDFDPSSLSIGISPTTTAQKGTPLPKQSSWIYSHEEVHGEVIDIYKMSSALVSVLAPCAARIRDAVKDLKLYAVLEVVLTISSDESLSTPAVGFDPEVVSFLSRVRASIDIDIY